MPAWWKAHGELRKENSFEGGFRIARREVIHAANFDE